MALVPAGWLAKLAGSTDSPRRTAAAFALGVFLSFSPLFGLQIAIGIGTAAALRLNRVAVFIGLCSNLPWLMVPWYALTTAAAAAVLGVPLTSDFGRRLEEAFALSVYGGAFWKKLMELVWPFLGSFILGSTLGAIVVSAVAYVGTARFLARAHASRSSP